LQYLKQRSNILNDLIADLRQPRSQMEIELRQFSQDRY